MAKKREEIYFFGRDAVLCGLIGGTLVSAMFVYLALPHNHALSPSFMDGIVAFADVPLAWRMVGVFGFSSICTAMFMSARQDFARKSEDGHQIELWPHDAVLEQKVMSFMAPIMSVVCAIGVWFFMLGDASPMHVAALGAFKGLAGAFAASWSVWVVSFFATGVTVLLLAAPKTVPATPDVPGETSF